MGNITDMYQAWIIRFYDRYGLASPHIDFFVNEPTIEELSQRYIFKHKYELYHDYRDSDETLISQLQILLDTGTVSKFINFEMTYERIIFEL